MESEPLTLQLFIGTADDRLLRPHAFYQVHRITGKTVSTASHEVLQSNTKLLEIPLLPENNMRAMLVRPFTVGDTAGEFHRTLLNNSQRASVHYKQGRQ
ncbi:hypothetical protein F2P81_002896 [Scophthalmus maximus]|uniref:RHD domain-containing protein n=1 Tax=Scophthalmus maximus TaxID=52904 RepID=A0A6A4TI38_SCOMX|nr:hypothetical protein F2P81_002896 [Scophthalmus maximus]